MVYIKTMENIWLSKIHSEVDEDVESKNLDIVFIREQLNDLFERISTIEKKIDLILSSIM